MDEKGSTYSYDVPMAVRIQSKITIDIIDSHV